MTASLLLFEQRLFLSYNSFVSHKHTEIYKMMYTNFLSKDNVTCYRLATSFANGIFWYAWNHPSLSKRPTTDKITGNNKQTGRINVAIQMFTLCFSFFFLIKTFQPNLIFTVLIFVNKRTLLNSHVTQCNSFFIHICS